MHNNKKTQTRAVHGRYGVGFTLIELLVVIAIIGILVGLMLPAIAMARKYAQVVRVRNDVKQIDTAIRLYYTEYQLWPSNSAGSLAEDPGQSFNNMKIDTALTKVLEGGNSKRIAFMRFDPKRLYTNGTERYPINPWTDTKNLKAQDCYYAKVDFNYNNIIEKGTLDSGDAIRAPDKAVRMPVVVWTYNTRESKGNPDKYIIGSWK